MHRLTTLSLDFVVFLKVTPSTKTWDEEYNKDRWRSKVNPQNTQQRFIARPLLGSRVRRVRERPTNACGWCIGAAETDSGGRIGYWKERENKMLPSNFVKVLFRQIMCGL